MLRTTLRPLPLAKLSLWHHTITAMSSGTESISQHIERLLQFILPDNLLERRTQNASSQPSHLSKPLILGLTGLQGSGKSTWSNIIVESLKKAYRLNAITVSLDDFYHTQKVLTSLRDATPVNKLYATRGQPGTHDEQLAHDFFQRVQAGANDDSAIVIPVFDKSQHQGRGDRADRATWPTVHGPVDVVVLEGWCIGFRPAPASQVEQQYNEARTSHHGSSEQPTSGTVADHELEHLLAANDALKRYTEAFMGPQHFDALVHLDTDDLGNVYSWRIDQEHALRKRTSRGMTDEEVAAFVRGYMPAYELYLDGLRKGFFIDSAETAKTQVRVVLDRDRKVQSIEVVGAGRH